jgi:hypothetical protein
LENEREKKTERRTAQNCIGVEERKKIFAPGRGSIFFSRRW